MWWTGLVVGYLLRYTVCRPLHWFGPSSSTGCLLGLGLYSTRLLPWLWLGLWLWPCATAVGAALTRGLGRLSLRQTREPWALLRWEPLAPPSITRNMECVRMRRSRFWEWGLVGGGQEHHTEFTTRGSLSSGAWWASGEISFIYSWVKLMTVSRGENWQLLPLWRQNWVHHICDGWMIMSVSYLSDKRQLTRVRRRNGGVALWEIGLTTVGIQYCRISLSPVRLLLSDTYCRYCDIISVFMHLCPVLVYWL